MHYKNGRQVNTGDWVIGISHNSQNKPVVGVVMEMMPKQGPCNIRIHCWREEYYTEEGHPMTTPLEQTKGYDDYGDAKEFILCADGLRMVKAVVQFGAWESPYQS